MSICLRLFCISVAFSFLAVTAPAQTRDDNLRFVQLEISALHDKTQAFIDQKQLEKALRNAQFAYTESLEKLGGDSKITATLGLSLANLYASVASIEDAQIHYELSLKRFEQLYGVDGYEVASVLVYMSMILDPEEQLSTVKRALAIQKQQRPEDTLSYALMATRLGGYLSFDRANRDEAVPILEEALEILEVEYGRKSTELIAVLMALGHAHATSRYTYPARQKHYYQRALRINRKAGTDEMQAELLLSAGQNLMNLSESGLARPFIINAYKLHEKLYGVDDARTAFARLVWARFYLSQDGYERALTKLKQSYSTFRVNDEHRNHELTTLALIVETYEKLDERDAATPYCQAIGEITPWTDDQKMRPVFLRRPAFPYMSRSRRGDGEWLEGKVVLDFTVDKYGFVNSPRVVRNDGSIQFAQAAIEASNASRYAPRFVDGKPVDTPNVEKEYSFWIYSKYKVKAIENDSVTVTNP